MLGRDFCDFLEYEICAAFENSDMEEVKGFWCDGIVCSDPDIYYSPKYINDKKQALFRAYIGKDGQSEYKLIIHFGPNATSRYIRALDLKEFVSFAHKKNSFAIDIKSKVLEIHLD